MIRVFKDCHHAFTRRRLPICQQRSCGYGDDATSLLPSDLQLYSATADISIKTDFADEIIHIFHDAPGVDVDEVSSLPCLAPTLSALPSGKCPLAIGCDQCPINIKNNIQRSFFIFVYPYLKLNFWCIAGN